MKVVNSSAEFKSAIQSGVTLVDFYADWCGPCKMIAPVLEQLSKEYEGKANIIKLDVDATPEVAQSFGVMSIPTLILFKDGEPVGKVVGFQQKAQLAALINRAL
ncbi:MAG: thioredoxin 1 [Erysipelotrichaceae bacterium]|nr:MAG: thioredoxin [Erysipelotrichaceae bacterium]TXT18995.1 MAG: thioredoxin 1 [Erysipelotrichaceae bacterium]